VGRTEQEQRPRAQANVGEATVTPETPTGKEGLIRDAKQLRACVDETVGSARVFDVHTHLFAPGFGKLNLWGVDELVTYHYLIAELFRFGRVSTDEFWSMPKTAQADLIWETLFVRNTPLSEAACGVVAVLSALGLDPAAADLSEARHYFRQQDAAAHVDRVFDLAGIGEVVMTNDPLDAHEARVWESGVNLGHRFHAALRLDAILNRWDTALPELRARGYDAAKELSAHALGEVRRFLGEWVERMKPLYFAVSLPPEFRFPEGSARHRLLADAVLPMCREHGLPMALMIGVRKRINPKLDLAGDGVGLADVTSVERLCRDHPDIRFLVTMLSRENQHELCVLARKFSNLMPFGCWWFLNNPSIVAEITRERIEMLGTSFIPQHSDARVLEQVIYKWRHSRLVVADALYDSYHRLLSDGRPIRRDEVARDVEKLFSGNLREWVGLSEARR
jgi:hypothetical protein